MSDWKIHLENCEATLELGILLAKIIAKSSFSPTLLLQGDLGSGKTTLVRGFVESLPGSDMAEVSSPSFNIFNLYPTVPAVAHFDLYRLDGMTPDDELFEYMDDSQTLTVIEWAQFLDREEWPNEAVLLAWEPTGTGRSLTLHAMGEATRTLMESEREKFKHFM